MRTINNGWKVEDNVAIYLEDVTFLPLNTTNDDVVMRIKNRFGEKAELSINRLIDYIDKVPIEGVIYSDEYLINWLYEQHFRTHERPISLKVFTRDFEYMTLEELSVKYSIWVPIDGHLQKWNRRGDAYSTTNPEKNVKFYITSHQKIPFSKNFPV